MNPRTRRRTLLSAGLLPAALSLVGCSRRGDGQLPENPVEGAPEGTGSGFEGRPPSPDTCPEGSDIPSAAEGAPTDWEGSDGQSEWSPLPDRPLSYYGLALFPGGDRIAANQTADAKLLGDSDTVGTVVWSTTDGMILDKHDNGLIGALATDHRGHLAAGGVVNVEIRDDDGTPLRVLTGGDEPLGIAGADRISDLAFVADGSHLVVLGADGRLTVWQVDGDTCDAVHELATDRPSATAFSLSPVDGTLAVCGDEGPIELWDPLTGTRTGVVEDVPGTAAGLAHAEDGTLIICTDRERAVHALSPSGELTTGPELSGEGPYFVAAAPGPRVAVVQLGGNRVQLWDRASGASSELPVVRGAVGRLAWSLDGSTLYGASPSQGLIAWSGGDDWESFEIP